MIAVTLWLAMSGDPAGYERQIQSVAWVRAGRAGSGTAFVIDAEGRKLVTCRHVVGDRHEVELVFPARDGDGWAVEREWYLARRPSGPNFVANARVLVRDDDTDLALLEAESIPDGVRALPLSPRSASPGERVRCVGNRSDMPTLWNLTRGHIRQVAATEEGYFWHGRRLARGALLQSTDVPAHEGDSGGALVNNLGEVVGVLTATEPDGTAIAMDVTELRSLLVRESVAGRSANASGRVRFAERTATFRQLVRATAWLRPEATGKACHAWVWDTERRLLLTSAAAAGSSDVITVAFPMFQEGTVVAERVRYDDTFWFRRTGHAVRGWVLARDPSRDLAIVEVESLPPTARQLSLAGKEAAVGDDLFAVGNPTADDPLWLFDRGWLSQRANHSFLKDGDARRVLAAHLPVGPNEVGMPLLDGDGAVVGLVTGERFGSGRLVIGISACEISDFIRESRPTWQRVPAEEEVPRLLARARERMRQREWKDARGDLERAVRLRPDEAAAWQMLGAVRFQLLEPWPAADALAEAVWQNPLRLGNAVMIALSHGPQ